MHLIVVNDLELKYQPSPAQELAGNVNIGGKWHRPTPTVTRNFSSWHIEHYIHILFPRKSTTAYPILGGAATTPSGVTKIRTRSGRMSIVTIEPW